MKTIMAELRDALCATIRQFGEERFSDKVGHAFTLSLLVLLWATFGYVARRMWLL